MRISGHCGKDRSGKRADSPEGPIRRRYQGEREKAMYETEERLRKKGKQAGLFRLSAVAAALVMVLPCLPSSSATAGTLWNSDNVPQVPSETVRFTGSQLSGDYMGVIARDSASGSLQNLVLDIQAVGPKDGTSQDKQIYGVEVQGGNPDFSGDLLKVGITTDFVGSGNNQATAFDFYSSGSASISAKEVDLSVTSTASNGKSVYGIGMGGGGTLNVTSDVVNIRLESATERPQGNYSEAIGIDVWGGKLVTADSTALNIDVVSHGTASPGSDSGKDGATSVYGIKFEGGQGELNGVANIDVSATGGNASGVEVTNYFYNTSLGENSHDSAATVGNLNVTASSTTGRAAGINTVLEKADDKNVVLKVTGDSVLHATTETGTAYGVNLDGATTIDVTGNLTATATASGEGGQAWSVHTDAGTLNLAGRTNTLNGDARVVNAGTLNLGSSSGNSQTNMNGNMSADSTSSIGLTNATLNLAAGKTVDVDGRVNSNNGTIAINGAASEKTVNIATLDNTGSTTFRTSSATAGQIAVGTLNNTGTVNLNLDSTAANDLTGKTAAEVAQNAANVLAVTTRNGDGQYNVAVAESSGVTGAITAKTDENGNIITSSVTEKTNTVMSSLMNISANNFLVFRSQMNDLDKRMGDLRTLPQADGIWARAIAGQSEYKQIHNTYQTLQIGADKRIGNLLVGATASYTDGDGTLNNGSSDDKNYTFGLYGSWLGDDGQFVDVIVKRHRLESEYDLAYTSGDRAKGSMDTSGTSLSVEYGWRLGIANTDFYIEPQAEFMYGHLNSVGYTTSNGVRISQDAIKTAVGRLGIAAGWVSPDKTGSAYIKASVLNDWDGDAKISATKGRTVTLHEDMGGTWGEFALGGTWNINKNLAAYGEVETTAGNPVRTTYQVSGGIRYSF